MWNRESRDHIKQLFPFTIHFPRPSIVSDCKGQKRYSVFQLCIVGELWVLPILCLLGNFSISDLKLSLPIAALIYIWCNQCNLNHMSKYENRFQAVPQKTECQKFLETNYTCLVESGHSMVLLQILLELKALIKHV